MEEFLRQNYSLLTRSVEILATVTGLLLFKKYKLTVAKYFIWFLVYLSICDFLGTYTYYIKDNGFLNFLENTIFEKNYWWSTLFWKIGAILFFGFYFQKIIINKSYKLIIKYCTVFFLIFYLVYIAVNLNVFFVRFFPIIDVLGAIIIFLCVILYFIEILQNEHIVAFYKSINFYIAFTILIWWLIITPLVFYDVYFSTADWDFVILKTQIYLFANIFMYLTFTFALIWCKPQNV